MCNVRTSGENQVTITFGRSNLSTQSRLSGTPASRSETAAWNASDLRVSISNIPHRHWLYGTYLIRGEITVLAAPGGAGKTALATGIAVEIATDTVILEEKIYGESASKVLFINGEDGGSEIHRRVLAFCLAHAQNWEGRI